MQLVGSLACGSPSTVVALPAMDMLVTPHHILLKGQMFAEGSEPGDGIFMEGQALGTAFPKTLKSDFWKKIVAELQVHNHIACCAKQKLVTAKGPVHLPLTVPDGAGIH